MTKVILTLSAAILCVTGAAFLFANEEIATALGSGPEPATAFAFDLAASGFFAVGLMTWMQRSSRIGGIYGRPLAMGNAFLFLTAAIALWRSTSFGVPQMLAIGASVIAGLIGAGFIWLIVTHDALTTQTTPTSPHD